ncbi:WxL domain-containing protein [Latilactobacillus fuchuensis]|uniref:WxL domain-containing protein n=1 Tax=Latilactobacillus fuchuensis DSM 14340 = JCM 11249 TaxID=1423747 RepID=A0A0R1RQJ9_9LACO|nr:WxL domain-containing protein [Latilactobacillus fuchuensis]KRL59536.1 hypothetical protein FC69_GL001624 [Latilactobacillus fuchuensis DSM 14340 = JCM 11249]
MQLTRITLLATTILAATVLGNTVIAHATINEDGVTGKTTAKFNVEKGGADTLQLLAVPANLDFKSANLADLILRDTNSLPMDLAASANPTITVQDYRGTGSKWHLNGNVSSFTNDKNSSSQVTGKITLAGSAHLANATTENENVDFKSSVIGSADSEVWSSETAKTNGIDQATVTLGQGTQLDLTNKKGLQDGTYTGTITWTLGNDQSSTVSQG